MSMYIRWDAENQTHIGVPSNTPIGEGNWLRCKLPLARTSGAQELKWLFLEGTHEDYLTGYWSGSDDPLDTLASKAQIVERHVALEAAPITVFGHSIDADERSETRLRNAVEVFDYLPEELGTVEYIAGTKVIYWKYADNISRPLDKESLLATLNELVKQRAIRGSVLFARLQMLKATVGEHTLNQINSFEYWGVG